MHFLRSALDEWEAAGGSGTPDARVSIGGVWPLTAASAAKVRGGLPSGRGADNEGTQSARLLARAF